MEKIKGYQWGDNGAFIGEYEFWNAAATEEIHMPPRTTLTAPPMYLPAGKEAAWEGETWIVRDEVLTHLAAS